uniref:Branched-chain-amino-acid transaminase n=1 Tax=Rhodosorus marinus TaxID=101924 RepID=A0A7S3ENL4_9RHOD|mmetsp:Transcript_8587/g.38288  ORF Transcript_8587/g.38288 Transcript_8587/m.38288 type:complete len:376 (+) Transcript_8587:75-1202(+)
MLGRLVVRGGWAGRRRLSEVAALERAAREIGSAGLEWEKLGFGYFETNGTVQGDIRDGRLRSLEFVQSFSSDINVAASALQYGQSCFEGLKAFANRNGGVKLFRPDQNSRRLNSSADRLMMPQIDEEIFVEACRMAVYNNIEFVPPYGTNGALYLRPILLGSSPRIGVSPATEHKFIVVASPVSKYYGADSKAIKALVVDYCDRAAPQGLGNVKTAANYAPDLKPSALAQKMGYNVTLYLDPKEHKYIEEFATSNFAAIKGDRYVTPCSGSILPSITNLSIQQLARRMDLKVERRKIAIEELEEFDEVASLGTAALVSPVSSIVHGEKNYKIGADERDEEHSPIFKQLQRELMDIQTGQSPDEFRWMTDALSAAS